MSLFFSGKSKVIGEAKFGRWQKIKTLLQIKDIELVVKPYNIRQQTGIKKICLCAESPSQEYVWDTDRKARYLNVT